MTEKRSVSHDRVGCVGNEVTVGSDKAKGVSGGKMESRKRSSVHHWVTLQSFKLGTFEIKCQKFHSRTFYTRTIYAQAYVIAHQYRPRLKKNP